ncbi:MAG: hypothetical protein GTN93_25560 [Anaerolineae bacterium]|nr:hypothetical protein [Anaerolineae bacterium]
MGEPTYWEQWIEGCPGHYILIMNITQAELLSLAVDICSAAGYEASFGHSNVPFDWCQNNDFTWSTWEEIDPPDATCVVRLVW